MQGENSRNNSALFLERCLGLFLLLTGFSGVLPSSSCYRTLHRGASIASVGPISIGK